MIRFLFLNLVALLAFSINARAQDNSFEKQEAQFQKYLKEKNCQGMWDMLWPLVKKDDAAGKIGLLLYTAPMIHFDRIILPGETPDLMSHLRYVTILAVHSFDIEVKNADQKITTTEILKSYAKIIPVEVSPKLRKCIAGNTLKPCREIAVNEHVVPSFEEFINEIETAMAAGKKPSCDWTGTQNNS